VNVVVLRSAGDLEIFVDFVAGDAIYYNRTGGSRFSEDSHIIVEYQINT